nr:DNA mismatch repair protein MutS [Methanosphaerula palustris]
MRQYQAAKQQYPDALLLFRMGDFYETFGADAEIVARELDIVLTSRSSDSAGKKIPLAGVPYHAADGYIARLVRRGYKVAVGEQVEDPKKAKGLVRREVVRVITPGTVIESELLGSAEARTLVAVALDRRTDQIGVASLDVSTGAFSVLVTRSGSDCSGLRTELARIGPTEVIVPASADPDLIAAAREICPVVTPYPDESFAPGTANELLKHHFQTATLEGFGCAGLPLAIGAAGAALAYALEMHHAPLTHITTLSTRTAEERMVLDEITLRNLELVSTIRGEAKDGTLLSVLDRTGTSMGARLLKSCLVSPLLNREQIEERLDAVSFFVDHPMVRSEVRSLLHRSADIERIAGRIAYGSATPRDLVTLNRSLTVLPMISSLLSDPEVTVPAEVATAVAGIEDPGSITDLIERALVDDPPANTRNGGMIRDGYDETLDHFRSLSGSGKDWILDLQQKERERTGIRTLKIAYNRVFGYYIEVTKANAALVPAEYDRKQTTTNGERYTTPALREQEQQIAEAEEHLLERETMLFAALLTSLAGSVPMLQQNAASVAWLDLYSALAEVAVQDGFTRPVIIDEPKVLIRGGRHPVVEQHVEGGFIPNDTSMDGAEEQILIITGANMAGKSTYMRSLAILCIMAQMGSFVPADHATIGLVDRVFTRVGAFDDLARGQSTFMVEMVELANILNHVTPQSLVILDEIGRGTSTVDGYSIARAVLEFLHGKGKSGPRTLFATHFHELVDVEATLKRVRNYHLAVQETGTDVIFTRQLIPGATDKSYGIHVATLAGVPRKVTDRATAILAEVMGREYSTTPKKARYTQMLLISPESEAVEHPAVKALRGINPDDLTPLQALQALYALKEHLRGGGV